jgi:hypothetical protein
MMKPEHSLDPFLTDHLKRTTPQIPHSRYRLDDVLAKITADRRMSMASKPVPSSTSSWQDRLSSFFGLGTPRMGFAMSVIAVQFAMLAALSTYHFSANAPDSEMRSTTPATSSGKSTEQSKFIRVSFKHTVSEPQMRQLLNTIQGDIVAGPSQLGEYYVLTPHGDITSHVQTLQNSAFVEGVSIVTKLP